MNDYSSFARQRLATLGFAAALSLPVFASVAAGGLVRNFDSVPDGDVISGGAVLSGPGAPGNPGSQMNNTAAPAWGNQAADYEGVYMVGNENLVSELGTSSLSSFTLTYAYKPDIPNDPDVSARQLAIRPRPGNPGSEALGITLAARRQYVDINGINAGLPAFTPAGPLMDGDPVRTNESGEPCCSDQSEWVFFAMTYEVLIPGVVARVNLYGMAASEAAAGLQEIHTQTGYFADNLDLTGLDVIVGNTGFGGGTVWRPADSSFDALTLDVGVLSVDEIAALGRAAIFASVPEPSSSILFAIGCVVAVLNGRRWKP